MRKVALPLLLLLALPAKADWADLGLSWRCHPNGNTFSILPVVNTSSGVAVPLQAGFTELPNTYKAKPPYQTNVSCNLHGTKIKALVYGAFGNFQVSLSVNGRLVFDKERFNSGAGFDPVLYKVVVTSRGKNSKPVINACRGNWDWKHNYDEGQCNEEP